MTPNTHYETDLAAMARSEQIIAWLRMGIAAASIAMTLMYVSDKYSSLNSLLFITSAILVTWLISSVFFIYIIRKGKFLPVMSTVSTIVDIFAVTAVQLILCFQVPLNFVNAPITSVYYIIIALCAIRKRYKLVIFAGLLSGIIHIVLTSSCYAIYDHSSYVLLKLENGQILEVSYLDEVVIALSFALFGFVIGYVTKALHNQERYYSELFENTPDGVLIISPSQKIVAANERFGRMVGVSAGWLINKPAADFLGNRQSPDARAKANPSLYLGNPTFLFRMDNTIVPIRTTSVPIDFKGDTCLELSVRDVAEQVKLERQLASAHKMETVGKLAGGLAHDFNNILSGILGATSLAQRTVQKFESEKDRQKLKPHFDVIQDCGENAANILGRLHSFSRNNIVETESLNLQELLSDTATICRNSFGDNITIIVPDNTVPLTIKGDGTSLNQAILNLCINAKDAIGETSGTLWLSARPVDFDEVTAVPNLNEDNQYCCIEVRDTGIGMDENTLSQIFDPFFTTKEKGKGTGIGLSMVYNVALAHGGCVDVSSHKGEGTTFKIYLEVARDSLLPLEPPDLKQ